MTDIKSHFGLIINPRAKGVYKRYILGQRRFWEALLKPSQYRVPESIEQTGSALKFLLDQGQGLESLGILGGDGTVHTVLNELLKMNLKQLPAIIPFRGGTINALCNNIGIKDSPEETLKKVVGISQAHPTQFSKYLIRITEYENGTTCLRYGFTFANGVFPKIFQVYYSYKNPGFGAALRLILKIFLTSPFRPSWVSSLLSPVEMRIENRQGELMSGKIRVLAVSTLESPTLWWKPFGPELNGKPQFHFLANAMTNPEVILNMFDLFIGRANHARHLVADTDELKVECDTGYVLDGELFSVGKKLKIKIDLGPALRFISL